MQRWKLILAYDGTPFHGWQIQPRLATIQGTLASALHHITGETVLPQGSGRTDAGVHALGQVASFDLEAPIPPANLLRALNRSLPRSIRILSAEIPAPEGGRPFHARHSAQRKSYEYRIFPQVGACSASSDSDRICPPFLAPYAWDCPWPFDLELANRAAAHIVGTHDFTSFAASDPDLSARIAAGSAKDNGDLDDAGLAAPDDAMPSCVRTIFHSSWRLDSGLLLYRVTGSGFLHHMVRNLVGTFVDAAAGRLAPDEILTVLEARDRSKAGPTAPACGLFLVSVEY
jgi:tRNA pseudouridine38-40 synthase